MRYKCYFFFHRANMLLLNIVIRTFFSMCKKKTLIILKQVGEDMRDIFKIMRERVCVYKVMIYGHYA